MSVPVGDSQALAKPCAALTVRGGWPCSKDARPGERFCAVHLRLLSEPWGPIYKHTLKGGSANG